MASFDGLAVSMLIVKGEAALLLLRINMRSWKEITASRDIELPEQGTSCLLGMVSSLGLLSLFLSNYT